MNGLRINLRWIPLYKAWLDVLPATTRIRIPLYSLILIWLKNIKYIGINSSNITRPRFLESCWALRFDTLPSRFLFTFTRESRRNRDIFDTLEMSRNFQKSVGKFTPVSHKFFTRESRLIHRRITHKFFNTEIDSFLFPSFQ